MNALRIALIQVAYDPAPDAMAKKYSGLVDEAAKAGAKIVILPELSMSPYFSSGPIAEGEAEEAPEGVPQGATSQLLIQLAKEHSVFLVGSLYERGGLGFRKHKGARYNTSVLFDAEGRLGAACRKQHLDGDNHHSEEEYYQKGNSEYPVFGLPEVNLALATGYDLWFPELARIQALKSTDLIVAPSALGVREKDSEFDASAAWSTLVCSHAIANGIFVAAANRVGTEKGVTFWGSSIIVAPGGEILAQGSRENEEVVLADLDPTLSEKWRTRFPLLLRREPETYGVILGRLTKDEVIDSEA